MIETTFRKRFGGQRGWQYYWTIAAYCLVWLILVTPIKAASAIVSQGFTINSPAQVGSLVSRSSENPQSVTLADSNNRNLLTGVVVNQNDSLVAYYNANSRVSVATSGLVQLNSSTINGDIRSGDPLTSSPIAGVAMKATENGRIIGIAQTDLNANTNGTETGNVKDKNGRSSEVILGRVSLVVGVADFSSGEGGRRNGFLDSVQGLAQSLTGRDVAPVRAIIAATLILIAMLISAIILYSSISSSIRSIGRNPLSHNMIKRSLLLVVMVVLLIMIAAFTISYIIIRR